jgi:hypothetical protein
MMRAMRRRLNREAWIRPRYNVTVRARDKDGQVVQQHRGHNIYLNNGREWLLALMSYNPTSVAPDPFPPTVGSKPPLTITDRRMAWMAVGAGGREQLNQLPGDPFWVAWMAKHGLGMPTFTQDDTDVIVTGLEAPMAYNEPAPGSFQYCQPIINVEMSPGGYPGVAPIVWARYTCLYALNDLNSVYGANALISEAAIYPMNPLDGGGLIVEPIRSYVTSQAIAYEAFPTITKTNAVQLEIQWTFKL